MPQKVRYNLMVVELVEVIGPVLVDPEHGTAVVVAIAACAFSSCPPGGALLKSGREPWRI